jgi:subtilisin family serine protease
MTGGRPIKSLVATVAALAAFLPYAASAAPRLPDDTYFPDLWYLEKIGAPEAWNYSLGFEGVTVAIIDSGVDIDHPDLKDNIWRNWKDAPGNGIDDDQNGYVDDAWGWDFVGRDNDPRPDITGSYDRLGASHGTINAGMVAARGDNGKGTVGVTWQSTVMALRALDSDGSGDPINVVQAVEYAVANGAKVINLSFAGSSHNDLLAIALRRAYDAGVFVVAAAGNGPDGGNGIDLDSNPSYPACLDQGSDENFVYGVAAVDDTDSKATFSNYGAGCVDLSAPGTRIISTQLYEPSNADFSVPYGGYYNGTSLAAPMVAGAVALIKSLDRNLTPKQITNILTGSAADINAPNPGYFGKLGRGRLDIDGAVKLVMESKKAVAAPTPTAALLPGGASHGLIAAASGPGREPEIRLFTEDGLFVRGFLAYDKAFRGGVNLAVGDFDGAGRRSIVTGAGAGGGPHVRVFDFNTSAIGGWFAFDRNFRGGVSVATGDIDGDGRDEVIAGAGPGGGPHVRIFRPDGTPIGGFFAYDKAFRGGVSVATGDIDGDGRDDIIVATASGMPASVRVFSSRGEKLAEFTPFGIKEKRGLTVAASDRDGDGIVELAVGVVGGAAQAFRASGIAAGPVGDGGSSFIAFSEADATGRVVYPLAMAGSAGAEPTVAVGRGGKFFRFQAFEARFRGGVRLGLIQ